ncbi:hypothetical protein AJ80_09723 [Polytolypa hystricis UAMH7299]|uniref:Mitochondrial mRNA processing protein PET127 n=1 Tax=Polytolypa hystricis (strain UAMH7299) TaxID=1447883 RepID=A0A2B7WKT3_POLH7|nr:hypothetical protein AJ80_09723 [Polytolypa hystricis UAMH7299]
MLIRTFRNATRPSRGFVCLSCRVNDVTNPLSSSRAYRHDVATSNATPGPTDAHVLSTIATPPSVKGPVVKAEKKKGSKADTKGDTKTGTKADTSQEQKKGSNKTQKAKRRRSKSATKAGTIRRVSTIISPELEAELERKAQKAQQVALRVEESIADEKVVQSSSTLRAPAEDNSPPAVDPNSAFAFVKSIQSQDAPKPGELGKRGRQATSTKSEGISKTAGRVEERGELGSNSVSITPLVDIEKVQVPSLSYGLDRVLFNPGVYCLQDPRSRVYNFDPYLGSIMPVSEFDFSALNEYITSSRDSYLRGLAVKHGKKYVGSSSSMTSVLSHFHFLLSGWREVNTSMLSQGFSDKLRTFTKISRAPAAVFLRYKDGVYAIDADKEFDSANVLMSLGKSMEKLLTLPKDEFERYRKSHENKIESGEGEPESYHYSTCGDFLMRSQLDAYDPRLPGTGMFDLKTRAVVSIRMDTKNYELGQGYQIRNRLGLFESFEREYFDMIRAAFLKYSLQVRVGRMDGILVAFHNIQRIFGFQYVSLPELDMCLHGQNDTALGDTEFQLSVVMWNKILEKATAQFPNQSLRFHFETRDAQKPFMYIFAEPVTDEEINAIQTRNQHKIDAFERKLLHGEEEVNEPSATESGAATAQSGKSPDWDSVEFDSESAADRDFVDELDAVDEIDPDKPLFAMALFTRSKVNGKQVVRPEGFTSGDQWELEYEFVNFSTKLRAWSLYHACQTRRAKELEGPEDDPSEPENHYVQRLRHMSEKGRLWRQSEDKKEQEKGVITLEG